MASFRWTSPAFTHLFRNPVAANPSPSTLRLFPSKRTPRFYVVETAADGGGRVEIQDGPDTLRRPLVSSPDGREEEEEEEAEAWRVDWEDQILADTVPLVGFVRMILHSGRYKNGDRLSSQHEKMILERLLPYHPVYQSKIGCGIDYIMVGYHPEFVDSRCLFIVRKDGELVDFSYWKCIKGLIRTKYPLHADNFILRHFTRRRHRV